MPYATTPPAITQQILDFCTTIEGATQPPVYVVVQPEPEEKLNDCYAVVSRKIARDGGFPFNGWIIWEWPFILLRAEHHAIWGSPEGDPIDVSPKRDGEQEILFLRHPEKIFDGVRHPLVTLPLRNHPLIMQYIALQREWESWHPCPGKPKRADSEYKRIKSAISALVPELKRMSDAND